jgi:hypothetical protein
MSLCAIIPTANLLAANDALEIAGYGPLNFSVPLYSSGGATYAGCHAWIGSNDAPFANAIKAQVGVVWEESDGDPTARFNALVNAQGVAWGANAPEYPAIGTILPNEMYRYGDAQDATLWQVIQQYDVAAFNQAPSTYPALIRQVREPGQVYEWKQPIDQYDAYKLLNPFTNQNDECTYGGKKWYVTEGDGAGNNVWQPGEFGWSETDPTPNMFVRAWNWLTGLFTWN